MKVVINTYMDGLNLSHGAIMRYCRIKDLKVFYERDWVFYDYYFDKEMTDCWFPEDIKRTDPILIRVIMELRELAASEYAEFKIIEIPDDVKFIVEYSEGGSEWLAEKHRTWDDYGEGIF